jgi:hypothetical protein
MRDEGKLQWAWDNVTGFYHNLYIKHQIKLWLSLYEFLQCLRFLGYDAWFDISHDVGFIRLERGDSFVILNFGGYGNNGLVVEAHIRDKRFEVSVNPIAFTSEIKALLELLLVQPME